MTLAPDSAALHASYGNMLALKKFEYSHSFALQEYFKAIEFDPEIHYSIGRTYCRLRRFKDAKEEFEKYILHFPDSMNAEEMIFWERSLSKDECNESCHSCGI